MSICEYYITPEDYSLAELNGISKHTLDQRVRIFAWPKQDAITIKTRSLKSIKQWVEVAKENGISYATLRKRINTLNWEPERASTEPLLNRSENMRQVRKMRKCEKRKIRQCGECNGE